jgi:hypothetical protein
MVANSAHTLPPPLLDPFPLDAASFPVSVPDATDLPLKSLHAVMVTLARATSIRAR